ncbi:hypothetical protein Ahy_B10g102546 [Arachis hypogaea]|uniref:Uncharacterized protein n=1 Tax=Arachis hypogaea TaxID=3818 RepID=A0A444X1X6_ARAHY|nr:hypothetical protein Ahy_B10g102546 [Arachis hypogaea]
MMELDGHGQGRDNGTNLLVRFLGVMPRRATLCPISIQRWDQMPENNTKKQLIQIYLPLSERLLCITTRILRQRNNACKIEKIERNFKYHMLVVKKMLGRPVCRSEVILSILVKKNGNYVNGGHNLAEQILEYFPEDQERAAAEGVSSKVLAHPNDAIGKVFGAENVGHRKKLDRYEETKIQLAALHKFLLSKYGDEVPKMSSDIPDI